MNPPLQSFVAVALPIMITMLLAMWNSNRGNSELGARVTDMRTDMNRRFEDLTREMNRRFDETTTRLDRIERKLDNHEERIVGLEERTLPIHR
jgi:hypothetical protein